MLLRYLMLIVFMIIIYIIESTKVHSSNTCEILVKEYEIRHGIPKNLLKAISRVESGRRLPGIGIVAWPWTINANGKPYVFETKMQAIAKVQELQKHGVTSIDVGCMQINLKHHPAAFASLEDAFDPAKNIAYAVEFLLQKKRSQGTWPEAVGHYHNVKKEYNEQYKALVYKSLSTMEDSSTADAIFNIHNAQSNSIAQTNSPFYTFTGRRIPVRVRFSPFPPQRMKQKPTIMRYGKLKSVSATSIVGKRNAQNEKVNFPKTYKRSNPAKGKFYRLIAPR